MAAKRTNIPVYSFNYILRVELAYNVPCKSIGAFEKRNEYEFIQEGGLNDYVHMRRKPISAPFTFEVERYVGMTDSASSYVDPLANGTELIFPLFLFVCRSPASMQSVARTYVFTGCTVMGKQYGELNAEKSGLLTEKTMIGYRELYCIDTPYTGF